MKSSLKFFRCMHCGNLVELIEDHKVPMICCGEEMTELTPGVTDGAAEKHVPMIETNGSEVTVTISSTIHPMTKEHHIVWILLQTEQGVMRKHLEVTDAPVATFQLSPKDRVIAAYEYCNLHFLWKAEVNAD